LPDDIGCAFVLQACESFKSLWFALYSTTNFFSLILSMNFKSNSTLQVY